MEEFNKAKLISDDYKKMFMQYLHFWRIFLFSIFIAILFAFGFLRYSPKTYQTVAKIKILDHNNNNIELPSGAELFGNHSINHENQIEVLKSFPIISRVVNDLELNYKIFEQGDIIESLIIDYPFEIDFDKSIQLNKNFNIIFNSDGLEVTHNNELFYFENHDTRNIKHNLPFQIYDFLPTNSEEKKYTIKITKLTDEVERFKNNLDVNRIGAKSDILYIIYNSINTKKSEKIVNYLLKVFNNDGVKDRQIISQRTIDFVNLRYKSLSTELDSIENVKEIFKSNIGILDFNSSAVFNTQNRFETNNELFSNQTQIEISKFLLEIINDKKVELIPPDLGISNDEINNLISVYNQKILDRDKILRSADIKNPIIQIIDEDLIKIKDNINTALNNHTEYLKLLNSRISNKTYNISEDLTGLSKDEKILRSINRNQMIKESLYIFLLQKREEAQISFAVTEPTIKIVENAITKNNPISPNISRVYLFALFIGFFLPFIVLYFIFLFDNKVHSREDLDKFSLNVLAEIPFFDLPESQKVFTNPNDRSIISESFRMLMSNVRYLQNNTSKSNIILVTSSIKGEGKTLNALNLSLSFSSVGKKVLLIGCDLRNPQIHKYINYDKNVSGLVDFLVDNNTNWKESIINPFDSQPLDIILSGPLPPNPLNLINNGNIDILLNDAKKIYDHIIIDSAPTLLVADTQSLINKSDILIFMTRCNVTDNDVLTHIKKVSEETETNVGVILNGVGQKNSYGYSYGYRYGYGYSYKYSYNYGYGYGYSADEEK